MNYFLAIKTAGRALGANKNRSFLTMLGIIIGISSVVIIFSVGQGAESLIKNQITSIGSNLIAVLPGATKDDGPPASVMGITLTTLKNKDIEAIERQMDEVEAASGYVQGRATIIFQNQSVDANFTGVESDYLQVEDTEVESGRFFSSDEDRALAKVAVLGHQVYQDLFNGDEAIGRRIKIRKENFTVIGVMKERGTVAFVNQDKQVFVPLRTAQKLLLGIDHISLARIRLRDGADLEAASEHIRQILRDRHGIKNPDNDDFSVRNSAQALELLGTLTGALSFFLAAIGAISLLVGGVGIMNIMLVSVNERINEIGLRKAVGAKRRDIEIQFLLEAIFLTVLGAIIGVVLGVIFSGLIALLVNYLGYAWSFVVPPGAIFLACGLAFFIGLVFGYYPARRAALLNPIEALRYE